MLSSIFMPILLIVLLLVVIGFFVAVFGTLGRRHNKKRKH